MKGWRAPPPSDGVATSQTSIALFRSLAASGSANLPDWARHLDNLGVAFSSNISCGEANLTRCAATARRDGRGRQW